MDTWSSCAAPCPGDRVRARVLKRKRAYAEARAVEVIEASPDRIEPRAPHPGAPWQVLPYERQLAEKRAQVREALERLGGFPDPPVEPVVAAVEEWGYRNKVEYSFGDVDGELALGFHRAGSWSEIEDTSEDVLASDRVDALRERVKAWCRAEGLSGVRSARPHRAPAQPRGAGGSENRRPPGAARDRTGRPPARGLRRRGARRQRPLDPRPGPLPRPLAGGAPSWWRGGPRSRRRSKPPARRLRFRISPEAFFQTNTEMAERLFEVAADMAGLGGQERVFDLYSGIGTIALALASRARRGLGHRVGRARGGGRDRGRRAQRDRQRRASSRATSGPPCGRWSNRPGPRM